MWLSKQKWSIEAHCSKVLLSIFNSTEDEGVPKRIELIATVVHHSGQIIVNLLRAQRISVIPHVIIQATIITIKLKASLHEEINIDKSNSFLLVGN